MGFQMVMEKTNLKSKARFFLKAHPLNKFVRVQCFKTLIFEKVYLQQKNKNKKRQAMNKKLILDFL